MAQVEAFAVDDEVAVTLLVGLRVDRHSESVGPGHRTPAVQH